MSKSSHIDMLNGPIAIKLILFALPVAASAFLQQLLNAADVAVVGRFASSQAMAAVGANTFVINLMLNLFVGLSVGANVVIARFIGERRVEDCQRAVHTSVALSLISGVFLSIVGWFIARPLLSLLSTPDDILDLAALYFRIYFLGMPFIMLFNFASAILRSKGDTRRPLYIMMGSGVVNVLLNLFFVVYLHLTVEGVALATLFSSAISSLSLLYLLRHETDEYVHVYINKVRIWKDSLVRICKIGIPAGLQGVIFNISNVLIQSGINSLGTACVAANTASLNFDYFCFFIGNSFGQAGTSFMSQNFGAQQIDRCKKIVRDCMILGPGLTFCISMLFILFAGPLSSLFTADPEVVALSVARFEVVITFYSIHSFNEILSGNLRAVGHSVTPAVINVIFICGVRLMWLFFFFPKNPDFCYLMYCYPISWVINISVLMPVTIYLLRKEFTSSATSLSATRG